MSGYVAPTVAAGLAYAAETIQRAYRRKRNRADVQYSVFKRQRNQVPRLRSGLKFSNLQKAVHRFSHTITYSTQIQSGPTAAGGNGFANLASTTANTSNPGLILSFNNSGFTFANANSGVGYGTLNNASYYSGIFEQVRLEAVTIKVFYTANYAASSLSTTVPFLPIVQYVKDYDLTVTAPTSVSTIADYPDMRTFQLGNSSIGSKDGCSLTWRFSPKYSQTAGPTPTNQVVINNRNDWLSTENGGMNTPYGLALFYLDCEGLLTAAATTAAIGNVTFYVTLHQAFKGLR